MPAPDIPEGTDWYTDTTVPVLMANTLDDAALAQAAAGTTPVAIVLWPDLRPLLLARSPVHWFSRTLAFYALDPEQVARVEALADAQRLGAYLQELLWTEPDLRRQLARDASFAYWLHTGVAPNLDALIAQAQARATPAGLARQFLADLEQLDAEQRYDAIWAEDVLGLLASLDDERDWELWKRQAKKLCPSLNLTALLSARRQRRNSSTAPAFALPQSGSGSWARAEPGPHRPGETPPEPEGWRGGLHVDKQGHLKQDTYNVLHVLRHHPLWGERLWWDAVRGTAMLEDKPLSDQDVIETMYWFGGTTGMPTTRRQIFTDALEAACKDHSRDPIVEPLDALSAWDGVERLDFWLSDHAGAALTVYTMALSRLLPVSMVARAYHPGCQYRYVIILEGKENIGKSKLLRELASPALYREISSSLDGKEAHIILQGAWLAEFGELESLGRTAENRLKSFISMQQDAYVPKYANYTLTVPRRTVFVGTTNEIGQEYFKGQTGNTRYLPLVCGEMHPDDLPKIRAQLFAEAKVYYQQHPHDWWMLGEEAEEAAATIREERREKSVYEALLGSWLPENALQDGGTLTTWWEMIAEDCLDLRPYQWSDPKVQREVVKALRALGWTHHHKQVRLFDKRGKYLKVRPWTLTL